MNTRRAPRLFARFAPAARSMPMPIPAVEAQSGASRDDLHRTVKQALASWPA